MRDLWGPAGARIAQVTAADLRSTESAERQGAALAGRCSQHVNALLLVNVLDKAQLVIPACRLIESATEIKESRLIDFWSALSRDDLPSALPGTAGTTAEFPCSRFRE